MSYLERPRVNFKGSFVANVPTGNNNNVVPLLDPADVILDAEDLKKKDKDLFDWLIQTDMKTGMVRASWNFFGDGTVRFENVRITSAFLPHNKTEIAESSTDPLFKADVHLLGHNLDVEGITVQQSPAVMVDVNPTNAYSSQIYSGEFRISGLDANGEYTMFMRGFEPSIAPSFWVDTNGMRNLCAKYDAAAAAVWQTVITKDNLEWDQKVVSPIISALQKALENADGLVVRYCTYFFLKEFKTSTLAKKFAKQNYATNMSAAKMVGTIGVWRKTELKSYPTGRLLVPREKLEVQLDCGDLVDPQSPRKEHSISKVSDPDSERDRKFYFGPVIASVMPAEDSKSTPYIALDTVNMVPEVTADGTKVSMGILNLAYLVDGKPVIIGPIPDCDQKSVYEQTAGIVEIPFPNDVSPNDVKGQPLCIVQDDKPLVVEPPYICCQTDDRGQYVKPDAIYDINVRLTRLGQPVPEGTKVKLTLLLNANSLGQHEFVVDKMGNVLVQLQAGDSQEVQISMIPEGAEKDVNDFRWWFAYGFYSNVRVYPDDKFDNVTDEQLTWDYIYTQVFRYYYLLYPAMSRYFPFNDQAAMEANALRIQQLTDPKLFNKTYYMPVTRELSPGKRQLIEQWCQKILQNNTPVGST